MTLPKAPTGPGRRLLQAIWDIAVETGNWPTFAELDRLLDSQYDIQAVDVLRAMPPGFLYGVGPSSPMPPMDSQEIGLTIAGVAACQNTSEILSVFVEFIQMATSTEKGWQSPTDQPDAQPSLTDVEFAAKARTLPAAGRDRLLQMLFLIFQTERNGWAGCTADPSTGHWTIFFNREIRAFRNVRDIDDYWSRRSKPWEAGRTASTPAAPSVTLPGAANVSYIFNAPVSGTNVAVGENATQHANEPNSKEPSKPAESDGDVVRTARIGGRYAIVAAIIGAVAVIIAALVPVALTTHGFGLFPSSNSSAGSIPSPSSHLNSVIGKEFHIDNTFAITVLNSPKCSVSTCTVDIRFRNISGYNADIGSGSFVQAEQAAVTVLCNPFPPAQCVSVPQDFQTYYYAISLIGNGNHYDFTIISFPQNLLLPGESVQAEFKFDVPPQAPIQALQLGGWSEGAVVRFPNS